ncbi:unnamed protein product [Caenorhabditis auriculariae]|uniref:Uncharacterized protein n=1 Tax=Caenorhabditis auriculariae TaxID=2777116 RepID=A0A8S1HBV0_9PELO|nr:unnamed protein product [Caenorhabditis auriculariae]
MRSFLIFLALGISSECFIVRRHRRGADAEAPMARRLSSEIRRKQPLILELLGPLAFGKKNGDDAKVNLPMIGKFGLGDVTQTVAKFTPEGMENQPLNAGTFDLGDTPQLGYMDRETTMGKSSGSSSKMSIGGLGKIELGEASEQGTGLLDFSKSLFPFLELPPLKNDTTPDYTNSNVDPSLGNIYYPKSRSYLNDLEYKVSTAENPSEVLLPISSTKGRYPKLVGNSEESPLENPYESSKPSPFRQKAFASRTEQVEDKDLLGASEDDDEDETPKKEGFIAQKGKQVDTEESVSPDLLNAQQRVAQVTSKKSLNSLGLSAREVYALCAKFAPVANLHCYKSKVESQFLERCRGYLQDCADFNAKARPLGAIANSFSSGVGLTYYDWAVNGIPYYAVNEEGGVGNGHHGKVDFGSWGGGYSDNLGVRDYWSGTQEYGANWYEGLYGYKTGWSVPLVQSLGVEGGQGAQVSVPIKEGELGRPISITNGYHVGPYIGLADRVGVDWLNGGVSFNKGFAVPLIGVGVNSGVGVGFPSVGTIMQKMGLNGVETLNLMAQQAAAETAEAANNRGTFSSSSSSSTRISARPAPVVQVPSIHSLLNRYRY